MREVFFISAILASVVISLLLLNANASQPWDSQIINAGNTISSICPTCIKYDIMNNMAPFTLRLNTTGTPIINATGNSANSDFNLNGFGNTGTSSGTDFQMTSARGTYKSPTALQNGDTITRMTFTGWDGSSYNLPAGQASLNSLATENWNTTHHGTEIRIANTATGTNLKTTSLRIFGNQSIGFGSIGNPNNRVILNQYENASTLLPQQHSYFFPNGNGLLATVVVSNSTLNSHGLINGLIDYKPSATANLYGLRVYVDVTAQTGVNTINVQLKYKDPLGTAITDTLCQNPSTFGSAVARNYSCQAPLFAIDSSATPITVSTTGTVVGTITYTISAVLEELN